MKSLGLVLASAGLGALAWTLAEYLLHRFHGHHARGRNHFSREHLRHHGRRHYFAPTWQKVATAAPVLGGMGVLAALVAGATGVAFTVGFGVAYAGYEVLHRRIHTHPPRGPYGRWARLHHLFHHFGDPWSNHGVTTSLWDHVFRTWVAPGRVGVPPHMAMRWLLDESRAVRPEYAADYALGRRPRGVRPDAPAPEEAPEPHAS